MAYIRYVMAAVKSFKRLHISYFVATCLVGFLAVIFTNQSAIAKQLDNWLLLPRTQGLTELYFADDTHLPAAIKVGVPQKLAFTVHNFEHETTSYRYKLIVVKGDDGTEQVLGTGLAIVHPQQSQTVNETIKLPSVSFARAAIKVELEYQGMPFGSRTLSAQHQSIQYWVNVVGLQA